MYSHATVTFENVFRLAYETLSSVLKCFGSNVCLCNIFLIKLRWAKNNSLHDK